MISALSSVLDTNLEPIPYNVTIDFTWWDYNQKEYHFKAKIRKRKRGDIFEFYEDEHGNKVHFTHRLTALNWCRDDLLIIK